MNRHEYYSGDSPHYGTRVDRSQKRPEAFLGAKRGASIFLRLCEAFFTRGLTHVGTQGMGHVPTRGQVRGELGWNFVKRWEA